MFAIVQLNTILIFANALLNVAGIVLLLAISTLSYQLNLQIDDILMWVKYLNDRMVLPLIR